MGAGWCSGRQHRACPTGSEGGWKGGCRGRAASRSRARGHLCLVPRSRPEPPRLPPRTALGAPRDGAKHPVLTHGIALPLRGLILQPRSTTGLARSPASTSPKRHPLQIPCLGHPDINPQAQGGTGRGRLKKSNVKYIQRERAGMRPPARHRVGVCPCPPSHRRPRAGLSPAEPSLGDLCHDGIRPSVRPSVCPSVRPSARTIGW